MKKKVSNFIKTAVVGSMLALSMGCIVFASGSHSGSNIYITRNGGFYNSGKVSFTANSNHKESVEYNKIETAGYSRVSIKKNILGVYQYIDYTDINVTSGSVGVTYTVDWGKISQSAGYYFFQNYDTAQHYVKNYIDRWS